MKLFCKSKKSFEEPIGEEQIEEVEIIDEEPKDIVRKIEVRDIKQYLVDEYERAKGLETSIKDMEKKIEDGEVINAKYEASLVLLDQYRLRIDSLFEDKEELKKKLEEQKDLTKRERERGNDLMIQIHRMEPMQAREEMREACIEAVSKMKGNLSKSRVEQTIMEVSV